MLRISEVQYSLRRIKVQFGEVAIFASMAKKSTFFEKSFKYGVAMAKKWRKNILKMLILAFEVIYYTIFSPTYVRQLYLGLLPNFFFCSDFCGTFFKRFIVTYPGDFLFLGIMWCLRSHKDPKLGLLLVSHFEYHEKTTGTYFFH